MAEECTSNCYDDALDLMRKKATDPYYSLALFPNYGLNTPMYVFVYFLLVKLMELTNGGSFAVAGTLITFWYDQNLVWNKSAHNEVANLAVPSARIWKPSLILLNSINSATISLDASSFSNVDSTGKVTTVIPKIFNAACPVDITYFPFDTQKCTLSIGNTEQGHQQSENIRFVSPLQYVVSEIFIGGGEFSFVGSNISTGTFNFSALNFVMPIMNVTFIFKRNPTYYMINVAVPCVILLFSSGLIFFLPSDNTVKIAMSCSLLMALYVLQQAISRVLPTTPTVPLLATGIMIELGLGCYSVLCAVLTVSLRALQPPLSPGCVKLIKAVERVFFDAPVTTTSKNISTTVRVIGAASDNYNSNAIATTQSRSHTSTKSDQLADSVTTLVQALTTQAESNEAKKLEQAEHLRHWKVLDIMLNLLLFLIYLIVAIVSCLKFLFGLSF